MKQSLKMHSSKPTQLTNKNCEKRRLDATWKVLREYCGRCVAAVSLSFYVRASMLLLPFIYVYSVLSSCSEALKLNAMTITADRFVLLAICPITLLFTLLITINASTLSPLLRGFARLFVLTLFALFLTPFAYLLIFDCGIVLTPDGDFLSTTLELPFGNTMSRWPTIDIASPAVEKLLDFHAKSGVGKNQQKALHEHFLNIVNVLTTEGTEDTNRYVREIIRASMVQDWTAFLHEKAAAAAHAQDRKKILVLWSLQFLKSMLAYGLDAVDETQEMSGLCRFLTDTAYPSTTYMVLAVVTVISIVAWRRLRTAPQTVKMPEVSSKTEAVHPIDVETSALPLEDAVYYLHSLVEQLGLVGLPATGLFIFACFCVIDAFPQFIILLLQVRPITYLRALKNLVLRRYEAAAVKTSK